ncbi:MAG: hypothetical protein ABIA11_04025 [Patescibacteria group bacterium]|nr:hypothetical protein [Patescibacteria group bacterium]
MPDTYNSILGFLIVVAVLSFFALRKRNESWKGKLIDKKHRELVDDDGDHSGDRWILKFETENRKKKKASVKKQAFDEANIGDTYEKKKGQFTPTKI